MRAVAIAVMVLGFVGFVTAEEKKDEKIDAKKLIGKWDQVFGKETKVMYKVVVEYTADGKVVGMVTPPKGEEFKIEGTYKLDGVESRGGAVV